MSQVAPAAPTESAKLLPAVELSQVRFRYEGGPDILYIPSLVIQRHERIFLYGPSR
jgi:ABC-type bacteriocin/lantibiotic exporter with double-glycine peptidase domain